MRKVVIFLSLSLVLSGCGFSEEAPATDSCTEVRDTAQRIIDNLPDINEVGKTRSRLELLRWAFTVTGDSKCFSDEIVATAKSTIALVSQQ